VIFRDLVMMSFAKTVGPGYRIRYTSRQTGYCQGTASIQVSQSASRLSVVGDFSFVASGRNSSTILNVVN
jgi:hypothetical protein